MKQLALLIGLTSLLMSLDAAEACPRGYSCQQIATVDTNDPDVGGLQQLLLMVDHTGAPQGLKLIHSDGEYELFYRQTLESPQGAIIKSKRGRPVIIVNGVLNRSRAIGPHRFRLTYLTNFVNQRYKSCTFDIRKLSRWSIINPRGQRVRNISIDSWRSNLNGGIERVGGICHP